MSASSRLGPNVRVVSRFATSQSPRTEAFVTPPGFDLVAAAQQAGSAPRYAASLWRPWASLPVAGIQR